MVYALMFSKNSETFGNDEMDNAPLVFSNITV